MTASGAEAGVGRVNETVVRVRYADTDAMGVAYHANYFTWFEVGRTEYLRQLGISYAAVEAMGLQLPVVECQARFLAPARYDDLLVIAAEVIRADRLRVGYRYAIRHQATGKAIATGETHHVFIDRVGRPRRVPLDSELWRLLQGVRPGAADAGG